MKMNYNEAKVLMTDLKTLMNLLGVDYEMKPVNESIRSEKEDNTLPKQLWVHVSWIPKSDEEWNKVFEFEKILPYTFDTGAGFGQRDWELDWSFHFKNIDQIPSIENLKDQVKEIILSKDKVIDEVEKLLSEAIASASLGITLAEEYKLTNEQFLLDLLDELNKLSTKY